MDINARGPYTLPYTPVYIPYHYKTPITLATNKSIAKSHTIVINLFIDVHPCFLSPIKMAGAISSVIVFVFIGLYLFIWFIVWFSLFYEISF